ncbi:Treslin [Armadillidium vulgare]|nr:Treslin [Armadillidium vulgare]
MASLVQVVFLIDVNYLSKIEAESELNENKLHPKLYLCCLRLLTELGAQTDKDNVRWSFKFYNSNKYKPDISHKIFYDFNLSSLKKFEDELQNVSKRIQKDIKSQSDRVDRNRLRPTSSEISKNSENNGLSYKGEGSTTGKQYSHSYILNKCLQETLFDYNWDRPDITSPVRDSRILSSGRPSKNKGNTRKSDKVLVTNEDLNFVIVFTHVPKNLEEVSKFIGQNSCSCSSDLVKHIFDSATLRGFIEEKKLRLHLINISKDRLDFTHKSLLQAALNKLFGGIHEIDNLVNDSAINDTSENVRNESQSIFLSSNEHRVVKGTELGLASFYWWNRKNISMRGRIPQPGPSLIWEDIDGVSFLKISLELLSVQGSSSKQWEDMYVKGVARGSALSLLGIGLPSSLLYVCHAPNTVFPSLLSVLTEQNLFMILQLQNGGLVGLAPWVGGVGCLVLFSSTQLTSSLSKFKLVNTSNIFELESCLEKGLLMFVKSAIKKVLKNTSELPEKSETSTFQRFQPQMLQSWYPRNEVAANNVLLKPKKSKKEQSMLERLQKKYCPQMPRPLSGTHLPPPAMIDVTQPASAAAAPDTPLVKSNVPAAINISKFRVSRAQKLVKNSKIVAAQMKVKEQQAEEERKAACKRKALEAQNRAQKKSISIMSKAMKKIKNPQDKDELAMALIKLRDGFEENENETARVNAPSLEDLHSAAQCIVNLTLRHIKTYFPTSSVEIKLYRWNCERFCRRMFSFLLNKLGLCVKKKNNLDSSITILLYLEVSLGYPRPSSITPDKRKSPRKNKDICEEYTEEIISILRMISLKYDPSTVGEFLRLFVVPSYQDSLGEILVEIFEELNQPLPSTLVSYASSHCNAPCSMTASSKVNKEVTRPQPRKLLKRETSNRQIVVPCLKRAVRRVNTVREKKKEEAKILVPETPNNAAKTTVFNKQRLMKSTGSTVITESPDIKGDRAHTKYISRRSSLPLSRRTSFYSSGNNSRNFEKGKLQLKLNHIKGPVEKRLSSVSNTSDSADSSFIFSEILNKNSQLESQSRKSSEEKKSKEKENICFQGSLQLKFGLDEEEDLEPYRPSSGRKMTTPRKRREPESPLLKVRRSLSLLSPVKKQNTDFNNDISCKGVNITNKRKISPFIEEKCSLNSTSNGNISQNITPKKLNRKYISLKTTFDGTNSTSRDSAIFCTPSKSPAKQTPKKSSKALLPSRFTPEKVIRQMKPSYKAVGKKENKISENSILIKECSVMVTPHKKLTSCKFNSEQIDSLTNSNENLVVSQTEEIASLENGESDNVPRLDLELGRYLTRSKSVESESNLSDFSFLGFSTDDANYNLSKNTSDIIKESLIESTVTPGKRVQFNLNATPSKQECNSASKGSHTPKSILKTPQKSPNINSYNRETNLENNGENLSRFTPKCRKFLGFKPSPFTRSPKFMESFTPPLEKEMPSTIINEMFINSTPSHFEALIHSPITSVEKNKCIDNKRDFKKSATSMMKSHRKLQMPLSSPPKKKLNSPDRLKSDLQEVLNSPKKSLMNAYTEFEIVSPLKKGAEAKIELVTYEMQDESTIEKVIELSFEQFEEKEVKEPVVHQADLPVEVYGSENSCQNLEELSIGSRLGNNNKQEVEDSEAMEALPDSQIDTFSNDECDPKVPDEFFLDVENVPNTVITMTNDDLNLVAELLNELDEVNSKNLTELPENFESIYRKNSNRGSDSGISVSNPDQIDSNEKEVNVDNNEDVKKFKDNINDIIKSLVSPCKVISKTPSIEDCNSISGVHRSPKSFNENKGSEPQFTDNYLLNKDILKEGLCIDEGKDDSIVMSSDVEEDLEIKEFPDIESKYLCRSVFYNENICEETNDQQDDLELSPEIPLGIKITEPSVHYEEINRKTSKKKLFESGILHDEESVDELENERNFDFVSKGKNYSETPSNQNELCSSLSIKKTRTLFNPSTELHSVDITSNTDNISGNNISTDEHVFALQIERDEVNVDSTVFQSENSSDMLPVNLKTENVSEVKNFVLDENNKLHRSPVASNINFCSADKNGALEEDCNINFETNSNSDSLIDVETVFNDPCSSRVDKADEFYSSLLECTEKNREVNNMLSWNSPSSAKKLQSNSNISPRRSNRKSKQTLFYESPINLGKDYNLFSPVFNSRRKNSTNTSRKLYCAENTTDKFELKDLCHTDLQGSDPSYKNSISDKFEFKDSFQEDILEGEPSFKNISLSFSFEENQSVQNPSSSKPRLSDSFEIISPQKNLKIFEEEESAGIPEHKKTPIVIRIRKKKKGDRDTTTPKGKSERVSKVRALHSIKLVNEDSDNSSDE